MDEIEVFYTNDDDGIHIHCLLCKWGYVAELKYPNLKLNELIYAAKNHTCTRRTNA